MQVGREHERDRISTLERDVPCCDPGLVAGADPVATVEDLAFEIDNGLPQAIHSDIMYQRIELLTLHQREEGLAMGWKRSPCGAVGCCVLMLTSLTAPCRGLD